MHRVQVTLTEDQDRQLEALARKRRVSKGSLVREGIELLFAQGSSKDVEALLKLIGQAGRSGNRGSRTKPAPRKEYPMRLIRIRKTKDRLDTVVNWAQKARLILMRRGRPLALVIGLEGEDLEEMLLKTDDEFWKELARRRRRNDFVSEEEAMRILGLPPPPPVKERRRSRPRKPRQRARSLKK